MNESELKQNILAHSTQFFLRDNKNKGYICPICGSGSGKNGTGITTRDVIHFTCWVGCFTNKDIFDIVGLQYGLSSFREKFQKTAELFGLFQTAAPEKKSVPSQDNETDYADFFLQAHQHINETTYHRGISSETLKRFNIGYVAEWKHPKAPKMQSSPRLIIPTGKYSYLARYAGKGDYINYRGIAENKSKVGHVQIFNAQALQNANQPIFVVEGEIDALSIIDVGGEAIGLGSISNTKKLISLLKEKKPVQPLIISMDNDSNSGTKERVLQIGEQLCNDVKKLGINCCIGAITDKYKDANEFFMADKEKFSLTVNNIINEVETSVLETQETEQDILQYKSALYSIRRLKERIKDSRQEFFSTGFKSLDTILDGGLYSGLYCIGAVSALGKTTFCLQMAENIAQAGHDVIIFSLETSEDELIAKGISRLTCIYSLQEYGNTEYAKTTRGILAGSRYEKYDKTEVKVIEKAISEYEKYGEHIYITEGMGNIGINEIKENVERYIRLTGKYPVVFIDYLQIISPADFRYTDKQNIDKNVLELKRLSRDCHIPIVAISSFNRENYTAPVNLTSFKESGAIEYSSDVLIGLQYQGMDYCEGETDKIRDKRIRELILEQSEKGKTGKTQEIQIKVLKNRNGYKGNITVDFYPKFNYFKEPASQKQENDKWQIVSQSYGKRTK